MNEWRMKNEEWIRATRRENINYKIKYKHFLKYYWTPTVKIINMYRDISFVLLVFQTFNAWGRKAIVVQNAAKKPIYFNIKFEIILFFAL